MPASTLTRDELVKYFFTEDSLEPRPQSWYIALIKPDGNEVAGADDADYVRQAVTFEHYDDGRVRNAALVAFPAAGTGADYSVDRWAVMSAETGGEEYVREELEFPKTLVEGQVLAFGQGDLIVEVG